jgi:hypothetical protein
MKTLKYALTINAVFSGLSGSCLILFNNRFQEWFEARNFQFYPLGIGLIIFAGMVFYSTVKHLNNRGKIIGIILADILWVVSSLIIVALRPFDISTLGYAIIGIVAIIVLTFAILQNVGLRRTSS